MKLCAIEPKELEEKLLIRFADNQNDELLEDLSDYVINSQKEIERLNNKINSIFSNFEQFINSYKNDTIDDFFMVLRLSEVVEFYNDLKEVISDESRRF